MTNPIYDRSKFCVLKGNHSIFHPGPYFYIWRYKLFLLTASFGTGSITSPNQLAQQGCNEHNIIPLEVFFLASHSLRLLL